MTQIQVTRVLSTPKRVFRQGVYTVSETVRGDKYVTQEEADKLVAAGAAEVLK